MRLLIVAAILAAGSAHASKTVRQGEDWVRIFDSPCVSVQTLNLIPKQLHDQFHKVQGKINGQLYFGCWQSMADAYYILWDDGDTGIINKSEFKEDLEV